MTDIPPHGGRWVRDAETGALTPADPGPDAEEGPAPESAGPPGTNSGDPPPAAPSLDPETRVAKAAPPAKKRT